MVQVTHSVEREGLKHRTNRLVILGLIVTLREHMKRVNHSRVAFPDWLMQHTVCSAILLLSVTGQGQELTPAALGRARQMLVTGKIEDTRAVVRSFQSMAGSSDDPSYRALLVEAKRTLEDRFDVTLKSVPDQPNEADRQLEALWSARARALALVPDEFAKQFDSRNFERALVEAVKLDIACTALFSKPGVAAEYSKKIAPEIVESIQEVNAELARFYPTSGIWTKLHPMLGNFRGAMILARQTRARAYLQELQGRPEPLAASKAYLQGRPQAELIVLQQIQRNRQALGLPVMTPDLGLSEVLSQWATEHYGETLLPKEVTEEMPLQVEALAEDQQLGHWVRDVALVSPVPANASSLDWMNDMRTVRLVHDPMSTHLGLSARKAGLLLVFAEPPQDNRNQRDD